MNTSDITLVIAIDKRHFHELRYTWPTWLRFRAEILSMPMIVIYDQQLRKKDLENFFASHMNVRLHPWTMEGVDQREKMLTSLVKVPATEVKTDWYLKLDVDLIATHREEWIDYNWFKPKNGRLPVYISHKWRYSKPVDILDRLDNWGDTIPELANRHRLNIPFDPKGARVYSPRIQSWCFFGNTEWTRKISDLCGDKLPVPSQDTLMYYCATRLGEHTVRLNMKRFGWVHHRLRTLKRLYQEIKDRV